MSSLTVRLNGKARMPPHDRRCARLAPCPPHPLFQQPYITQALNSRNPLEKRLRFPFPWVVRDFPLSTVALPSLSFGQTLWGFLTMPPSLTPLLRR